MPNKGQGTPSTIDTEAVSSCVRCSGLSVQARSCQVTLDWRVETVYLQRLAKSNPGFATGTAQPTSFVLLVSEVTYLRKTSHPEPVKPTFCDTTSIFKESWKQANTVQMGRRVMPLLYQLISENHFVCSAANVKTGGKRNY